MEKIRSYNANDRGPVIGLLRLNTPEFFAPEEEADFRVYLDEHAPHYFVVEDTRGIIGCGGINYLEDGVNARISWDMIHPDAQGRGIGSKLTRHRIALIRSRPGIEVITVRTSQYAYKYYERFGFVLARTKKDFWAPGFDLYHMELKIR